MWKIRADNHENMQLEKEDIGYVTQLKQHKWVKGDIAVLAHIQPDQVAAWQCIGIFAHHFIPCCTYVSGCTVDVSVADNDRL